jgi:hypothetical protein
MKKLLGILAASALAVSAFAQGTVVFNNSGSSLVKQWTSATDNTLFSVPKSGGSVELFYAAPGTAYSSLLNGANKAPNYTTLAGFLAGNAGWTAGPITSILPIAAGQFNGGTVTLTGIAAGANASYAILGWNGSFASLDLAMASALTAGSTTFIGESTPLATTTGGAGVPPSTATALNASFQGMTLVPVGVPEPSTFALAGLGAAAMLILRRRK